LQEKEQSKYPQKKF